MELRNKFHLAELIFVPHAKAANQNQERDKLNVELVEVLASNL